MILGRLLLIQTVRVYTKQCTPPTCNSHGTQPPIVLTPTQSHRYNTKYGVYKGPYCGLRNVHMSFGHDEYLFRVLQHAGTTLPPAALFIIRYHSFYALHQHDAYDYLLDDYDRELLPWLKRFQPFDLYSKSDTPMDVEKLKPYYMGLLAKYFPKFELQW